MKPGTDPSPDLNQPTVQLGGDAPTRAIVTPEPAAPAPTPDTTSTEATAEVQGLGLSTKYFLMAAALIGASIGSAVAITAYRAEVVANRTVREALSQVENVWRGFLAEREVTLRGTIRTLADEPQTRALLAESVSPETVRDWTADKVSAIGADFLAVLDPQGIFLARNDQPVEEIYGSSVAHASFVQTAMEGRDSSALIREGDKLFIVAAAPVLSGQGELARLEGIIFAGYPIHQSAAEAVAALSGNDATFIAAEEEEGKAPRPSLVASTDIQSEALVEALAAAPGTMDRLLVDGETVGPVDLYPGRDHVIAVAFPLQTGSGYVIGAFVSSRSLSEAKAAFTQIQWTLLVVGLLALLVSVPASYLFGRRIAKPLMALASGAHAIREGRLDVSLPEGGRDEIGALARSFARLVGELREKAELEKFVAGLGVSTQDVTQGRITSEEMTETLGAGRPETAPSPAVPLETGRTLGNRYLITALLGRGGMGSVWRAWDRELDEEVALKVIREDMLEGDATLVDQLKEEIRLARRITHPNVLRTHDFGELEGIRFISMEFVPGPTLRTVIDKRGQLSLPAGLQLGRQICRGLAAAHHVGIVHRDIKPQNIIIGPNGVVKVMDFGIALSQERHESPQGDGMVVGTPDYMSPEQIEGHAVDARADIYAVGIVLYEMFTGKRPFKAGDTIQTLMRNLQEIPPPLRTLRPDLPEALEQLIVDATAKKPDQRIQSAQAMRRALGKISS